MQVEIKLVDNTLPFPKFETPGAAGFDLHARVTTVVEPKTVAIIPGNAIVKVPEGYVLTLCSRSSTPRKKGLLTPHGIGIIDQDYHGEEDELGIQVYNFTDQPVTVEKGERVAQGLFVKIAKPELIQVQTMKEESRGGFGTTG